MSKSCAEQLRDIAKEYAKSCAPEYQLDELVEWAISTKRWELGKQDIFKECRRQFRDALKSDKDDDGDRIFLTAELQQRQLWAHRGQASWQLKQTFIDQQARRVAQDRKAVERLCAKLNAERKHGEPEFQLHFPWDDSDEQVA